MEAINEVIYKFYLKCIRYKYFTVELKINENIK